ncbi:hypothetical protein LCGC14_1334440 [marine sediment metagenome]|uniref:Uncharacterized protein n=1 Tax=marine sediment metagenome TaxID=412755 RepID=A0A0F9MWF6_9ZZZZ
MASAYCLFGSDTGFVMGDTTPLEKALTQPPSPLSLTIE